LILIGLFCFISMLYYAKIIIVPIILSLLLAILINPIINCMTKKGMNRLVAIWLTMVTVGLFVLALIFLLSLKMGVFIESFPILMVKSLDFINKSTIWLKESFNISTDQINNFITDSRTEIISSTKSIISSTLNSLKNSLFSIFLIPVYVFLFILYKSHLLTFLRGLFISIDSDKFTLILISIKTIIQKYLTALFFEAIIIGVLNSVVFLIIGVEYAIIIGVLGALLNVIPYIGGVIAISLPIIVVFANDGSLLKILFIFIFYIIIQFLDNYVILPKLVSLKVKINSLISIIAVLAGGTLWGATGMFLSIPLIAILKIIFDHIEVMKPWGLLFGDTKPSKMIFRRKAIVKQN